MLWCGQRPRYRFCGGPLDATGVDVISWHKSITARYAFISVLAAIGPTLVVGGAYDRYSSGLVDTLTGERLDRRLAAISSRLTGFIDVRTNELDILVNYPGIGALTGPQASSLDESALRAVVELEADNPDLYGILLFDGSGSLVAAVPSQAASGPPYWGGGDEHFSTAAQHLTSTSSLNVVGPYRPSGGRPGSMLMLRAVPGARVDAPPLGWVGLHVRLASLTEMMGANDDDLFQTVLLAPDGNAYSNVGVSVPVPADIVKGSSILPGWNPALVVAGDRIAEPLRRVRRELILVTFGVTASLIALFFLLSRRLTARIHALVEGSQAIAAGTLSWHIAVDGQDEIAAVARAFNRMTEQLQTIIHSAVEAEKMAALGRLAAGLAHEVRNPLSTVKTTVQALLATEPVGERRDILLGMDDEIDRLDETVNDFLMYARPRPPQLVRVMIWGLLDRLGAMANNLLHENNISLVKLGEPDVAVMADPGHIKQIVMNLVLNAIQAMPEGGVLTIRARRDDGSGVIEISDTGTGMTDEVLSRVTEPFFTTRHDGTGLGLSISRQLIELNGGTLEFFSAIGHGTTVMLRLPLAEASER
jgi:two-component system, NtrC family, sensor histidine kinase HydH